MTRTTNLDGGGSIAVDEQGGVYVAWHANAVDGEGGEEARRVWIAGSTNEGDTFSAEYPVSDPSTGVCGCCALGIAATRRGELQLRYRSATATVNRDMHDDDCPGAHAGAVRQDSGAEGGAGAKGGREVRSLILIALFAFAPFPAFAQTTPAATPVTLGELEQLALQHNPTAAAAAAGVDAARGRTRQAGAWPNPVIGYSGEELKTGDLDRRGEHGFSVEQTVPLGGKLRLSRDIFQKTVDQTEAIRDLPVRQGSCAVLLAERRVAVRRPSDGAGRSRSDGADDDETARESL